MTVVVYSLADPPKGHFTLNYITAVHYCDQTAQEQIHSGMWKYLLMMQMPNGANLATHLSDDQNAPFWILFPAWHMSHYVPFRSETAA